MGAAPKRIPRIGPAPGRPQHHLRAAGRTDFFDRIIAGKIIFGGSKTGFQLLNVSAVGLEADLSLPFASNLTHRPWTYRL